jgi:hypothetical protein
MSGSAKAVGRLNKDTLVWLCQIKDLETSGKKVDLADRLNDWVSS